jgi:hypothetical protein
LIVGGKAHDVGFLDRTTRGFLRCREHEVSQRPPLNLCGALEQFVNAGWQTRFETSRAGSVGHIRKVRQIAVLFNSDPRLAR